jgi:hypothetical protein
MLPVLASSDNFRYPLNGTKDPVVTEAQPGSRLMLLRKLDRPSALLPILP